MCRTRSVVCCGVSSNTSISAIGVRGRYNERGDFLISTTPALADDSVATNAELVFPHIVTGGGYTTEFILMNRGNPSAGKGVGPISVRRRIGASACALMFSS